MNNLIECFEIYIDDCINKMIIFQYSPFLHEITIDKVLSFNYSDTFERCPFYHNDKYEICYIHGKASTDSKKNNMVLGIDEYLSDEEKNNNIEFVELKKFFQRIHKRTGCEYKKWISAINEQQKETENNVYIWGHSLSMTDKDILREFLLCKNTKITVFYHDDKQFKQQIANLIPVLGHDKLIEMTYEYSPKLTFLEQGEMCNKEKLGYDIKEETSNFKNFVEIYYEHEKNFREKHGI